MKFKTQMETISARFICKVKQLNNLESNTKYNSSKLFFDIFKALSNFEIQFGSEEFENFKLIS